MEREEKREEEKRRRKQREEEGFKRWRLGLIFTGVLMEGAEEAAAAAINGRFWSCDGEGERDGSF